MSMVRASVIVTVYNKAPYLRECFDSILTQGFDDFEVIAVDDWSTDGGPELIRGIGDDRIRLVRTERNLGPAGAAQRGFDLARGEYIIRVDADDICVPDRFAMQVEHMDAHPDIIASGGHLRLFGAETGMWKFPLTRDACRSEVLFGNPIAQPTAIIRVAPLRQHGTRFGDDWPRIGEDWMLWARMLQYGEMDNLDRPLVEYRRGEQNSTFGIRRADYRAVILKDVFSLLDIPFDEERCGLHLMALRSFRAKPDGDTVRRFKAWLDELRSMNTARGLFPEPAFGARLDRAWDELFYSLPAYGVAPALAHLRSSGHWPMDRVAYLAKYTLNRWLRGAKA